jgi:hypothetical protein
MDEDLPEPKGGKINFVYDSFHAGIII